jgi:competence protein ComEA
MKTTSGEKNIVVDISGSVKNPGVYVLPASARIDELLKRAGGMADDADVAFASRNVNRARILTDQEKIYIPSLNDTAQGIVSEYKRVIDYTQPVTHLLTESSQSTSPSGSALVNINTAAIEELDQLPGVGAAIGQSIISKRPYLSIDELVQRSVVKQTVFDKIKNSITVQE